MPNLYQPVLNAPPFDFDGWLTKYFAESDNNWATGKTTNFARTVNQLLLGIPGQLGIELDDFNHDRLQWILVLFASEILANPPRTRRKLLPTIVRISRDPERFLSRSELYDPEAAALVLGNVNSASPKNEDMLFAWEVGYNDGSRMRLVREVRAAAKRVAKRVRQELKEPQPRGRPGSEFRPALSLDLAKLFLAEGGVMTRNVTTRDKLRKSRETGLFHQFLEIVLQPLKEVARHVGIVLTVDTMVREAMEALKPPSEKPPN